MARYSFGAFELQRISQVNFEDFVDLVKGRSIVSLGDFGPDRVEIGLSGQVMLRIIVGKGRIDINCVSTRNSNDPISVSVPLGEMPQGVTTRELDRKLRGLRTAYAIFYALEAERERQLVDYIARHPSGDLERVIVPHTDLLEIESLSYGSWIATIRVRSRQALNAIKALATAVFPRTRDAFIKKLEAEAELAANQAEREGVAVEKDRFELRKEQFDYLLQMADRFGDEAGKDAVLARLRTAIYELGTGDLNEEEIRRNARRMLPEPSRRKKRDEEEP